MRQIHLMVDSQLFYYLASLRQNVQSVIRRSKFDSVVEVDIEALLLISLLMMRVGCYNDD